MRGWCDSWPARRTIDFPARGGNPLLGSTFALKQSLLQTRVTSMSSRVDVVPMITLRPKGAVPALLILR